MNLRVKSVKQNILHDLLQNVIQKMAERAMNPYCYTYMLGIFKENEWRRFRKEMILKTFLS